MDSYKEYFPTKSYRLAELRLSSLLRIERDRLDGIASSLGRECAIGADNLREQLPQILQFTESYHVAYDQYLKAVLVQQPHPIQCRPACGNCCHHYPMSVEPFELISMYCELRKRDDLLTLMEACQMRSDKFESFFELRKQAGLSEDDAEDGALHDYFAWWHACPFSNADGDCTIYPLRTVSCRMYFSETDPKYCTPDMLQTEKNDSYIVYMPDVVEDAVYGISEHYSALDLPESFFGGLLALNGYEGVLGA